MKLRTKVTLFFGIFFLAGAFAVVGYIEYVVSDTFKKQIANNLRIFAEQSEGAYYTFLGNMKGRAVDWSSDLSLQRIVKLLLAAKDGTPEMARFQKEFTDYMVERKMPYDKTIFLADILDKDGIVIASTNPKRIGVDERAEETLHKVSHFSKTITSKFGEAFVKSIVFEEDETTEPMVHATARFFSQNSKGEFVPLDAVLLIHFLNIQQIADVLSGESQVQNGAQTGTALLSSYNTSEIYLVNSERFMVTPSRYAHDIKMRQTVDTFPVRECLEKGKEISAEYDDYRGTRVFGASMCLQSEGLVLIVEVGKDEIFTPLNTLILFAVAGGLIIFAFGIFIAIIFVRKFLARIDDVTMVAKLVVRGDLDARVVVRTKDEIGYLGSSFNTMITSVRDTQRELEASKREVEKKALVLEKDVAEHEKQQKFLEESKKATVNLLEDSWKIGEKLKVESNRLQTILASIGDGLVLIDGEYKIILVNVQALKFLAMSNEELMNKDLREIMKLWKGDTELTLAEWPIEEMFLTKSIVTTTVEDEFSLATTNRAAHLPVAFSIAPLGNGLSGGIIVIRDVTADRELDEAKSGFISVASHQLRTPLTSIRWYAEMLLSGDVGELNPAQKDFMTEVHGGAERLYQTVDLLLGISRVESGKIKTEKQLINLSTFTGEIAKELASQIDEKGSTLSVLPPDGDPIIVSLDSITLRQVVLNIFSNAIRYTSPKDGIIEIAWRKKEEGNEVVYSVRDNGIGIPEAERSRVFSKFFRAENARATIPDGSGLGLALVKELVESWGGKVWFETEEGKGSTFFFTMPFAHEVRP